MPKPKPKSTPSAPFSPSSLPKDHLLLRLGAPQGSNQFATEIDGAERLVEMPARLRRVAFAARGMFAIVQLYDPSSKERLAGEIVHVVTGNDVKTWRKAGEWPKEFDIESEPSKKYDLPASDSEDEALPENTNRRRAVHESDSESEEESDDE